MDTDNAEREYAKDRNYAPYCTLCHTTDRMDHTATGWECARCGAIHDSLAKLIEDGQRREIAAVDNLAIDKAGNVPGWRPYRYAKVVGGMSVTGCLTGTFKRGPRKGQLKFLTAKGRKTVYLSIEELLLVKPGGEGNG